MIQNGDSASSPAPLSPEQPKTAKGRARVVQILEVARRLFTEGGYGEMTMRRIAEQMGISLSNVQHYFPSREALLQALLESVMNSYDPAFAEIQEGAGAPREKLAAAALYLLADSKKQETERLFVEIWSLATRDPIAREIFDAMYVHHRRNLEGLVAACNPALPQRQVALRAALVAMQIEGLMLLISDGKPKHNDLVGIEEECVAAILNMVEAPAN